MPIDHYVWNPPRRGRKGRKGRRRHTRRRSGNPTGIAYSGIVLRPRRKSGRRPRLVRFLRGLRRSAFIKAPKRLRGKGLYRLARSLAPRGGKRKLLAQSRKSRHSTARRRRRARR